MIPIKALRHDRSLQHFNDNRMRGSSSHFDPFSFLRSCLQFSWRLNQCGPCYLIGFGVYRGLDDDPRRHSHRRRGAARR